MFFLHAERRRNFLRLTCLSYRFAVCSPGRLQRSVSMSHADDRPHADEEKFAHLNSIHRPTELAPYLEGLVFVRVMAPLQPCAHVRVTVVCACHL